MLYRILGLFFMITDVKLSNFYLKGWKKYILIYKVQILRQIAHSEHTGYLSVYRNKTGL